MKRILLAIPNELAAEGLEAALSKGLNATVTKADAPSDLLNLSKRKTPHLIVLDEHFHHHGCLGNVGDLGVDLHLWVRVQMVTYGSGKWVVRVYDVNGNPHDVADVYNTNQTLARAEVDTEESWFGNSPSENPWVDLGFYNLDLKYKSGGSWLSWPAGNLAEYSASGADICPSHYRVVPNAQGNSGMWYAGIGGVGTVCSGSLY